MSFDIEKGKKRFLALLNEISSERKGIEPLVAWLEKGDFFSAPLTANQRGAYKGGLLEHSLNVYMAYMMLFAQDNDPFSSVVLITLLHKLCDAVISNSNSAPNSMKKVNGSRCPPTSLKTNSLWAAAKNQSI